MNASGISQFSPLLQLTVKPHGTGRLPIIPIQVQLYCRYYTRHTINSYLLFSLFFSLWYNPETEDFIIRVSLPIQF